MIHIYVLLHSSRSKISLALCFSGRVVGPSSSFNMNSVYVLLLLISLSMGLSLMAFGVVNMAASCIAVGLITFAARRSTQYSILHAHVDSLTSMFVLCHS